MMHVMIKDLIFLVAFLGTFKATRGITVAEMKFLNYTDTCREDGGLSKCDPEFTFCLDTQRAPTEISPCRIASTGESGFYQDTNYIDFSSMTDIKGIPNPWIVRSNLLGPSFVFVVRSRDDDYFGDDHLQTWGTTLKEIVYPSRDESVWNFIRISSNSFTLAFQIRLYCDANYYTSNCSQYCTSAQRPPGHFMCDPNTLNKMCTRGWTGENCTENIDECSLHFCANGTCEDLQGDYICNCPPHYTGKNCTEVINTCNSKPCKNNGTCTVEKDLSYNCTCVGNWEGENCDTRSSPCRAKPCQNGMDCFDSPDRTNYSCSCTYPYTGVHCETIMSSTISSTTIQMSARAELTTSNSSNATGGVHTGGTIDSKTEEEGFKYWYGIIIAVIVVLLIIIIIIIIFLVVRRRRRKQKEPFEKPVVCFSHDNLAFENTMYNDIKRNPSAANLKQKVPLPTTPTDDENFPPMMPVFTPNSVGSQAAKGGGSVELDMDADGYVKPSSSVKGQIKCETVKPLKSEQVGTNPYADFSTLKANPEKHPSDEVHYHDLDEMANAMKDLDAAVKEHDLAPNTDGSFNAGTKETPYNDVPSNIPVGFSDSIHLPASPERDEIFNDPFASVPGASSKENPYTEPATEQQRQEPEGHHSSTEKGPYAEMKLNIPRISDPFASEISDEEDLPDFGLPQVSPSADGGYATPKGSRQGNRTFRTQESQYDTPSSNQPSNRSSANSNMESPVSSMTSRPPAVPLKPASSGSLNKSHSGDFRNDGQDMEHRSARPPVPPRPAVRHPDNTQTNGYEENFSLPISVKEGYTLDGNDDVANTGDSTNSNRGLYLENYGFSNT